VTARAQPDDLADVAGARDTGEQQRQGNGLHYLVDRGKCMVGSRRLSEEVTVMGSLGRMTIGAALVLAAATVAGAEAAPAVYDAKCKVCHSIGGDAGKLADKGGPLDGVGAKRDEAWLRAYLADPKSQMPDAKMPVIKLTPEEMDAVVKYMLSLK